MKFVIVAIVVVAVCMAFYALYTWQRDRKAFAKRFAKFDHPTAAKPPLMSVFDEDEAS